MPLHRFAFQRTTLHAQVSNRLLAAMNHVVSPPTPVNLPIAGDSSKLFPVRRVYCVARNYADHIREMGGDPNRGTPFFFTKPCDSVVLCSFDAKDDIKEIPYAQATENLHHEIELVVAIGKEGINLEATQAIDHVYGYAVGVDLTRRDLQNEAKKHGRPWDCSKGFDQSAPIGLIHPIEKTTLTSKTSIWLDVNGEPGDLIFTGTPSGVSALEVCDKVTGEIEGLSSIAFKVGKRVES